MCATRTRGAPANRRASELKNVVIIIIARRVVVVVDKARVAQRKEARNIGNAEKSP